MSRPTLQRLARLSLVPGICTALALVAGAYANPDNTGKDASVAVQAVDTGNELSGANPSPAKVIGGALGSRLPSPRVDGYGGLILAGAGQCNNDCGVGDVPEGEVCAGDFYVDATNGGCNSVPSVFGDAFCDVIICGSSSTFDTTGDGQSNSRDTDWYLISAVELAAADTDNNGVVQFQSTLTSEFDGVTFFIAFDPDCDTLAFPGSIGFSGADCVGGESAVATLILDEHPAGVVVFVSTGQSDGIPIFTGFECTTGLNDYTLLVTCDEPPLDCAPGSGPCGEPNESPGCEDPECCKEVCAIDPLCCIEPWSQNCANIAIFDVQCAGLPCPVSSCDGGVCTLTQSQNSFLDSGNQIACAYPDGSTTDNFWARCYNLVAEGVPVGENLTINSVTFGVAQATSDGINVAVTLYLDCNGCTPDEPGLDALVLATQSLVVNIADVGTMITVNFPAGTVVPAGTDLIVEVGNVDDGFEQFAFRTMSNDVGQCAPTYLRSPCSSGWDDLADIGFPDSHVLQSVSATVGGVVTVECLEVCGKGAGPCNEPNVSPGCEDPACCAAVCAIDPLCCIDPWSQNCVVIAVGLGCAPGPGQPADLATGPNQNADGYLRIGSDAYGSYAVDFAGGTGLGDTFNPVGALGPGGPTFSQNFSVYRRAQGEGAALTTHDGLLTICPDASMTRAITSLSVLSDTNGDGVDDTRVDSFDLTSPSGMDTSWHLTQHVFNETIEGGSLVAIVTFDFVITNNGPPVDFILQRHLDMDSLYFTNSFADDNVGTATNGSKADRFIYQGEVGAPETHVTLSSPQGGIYYGGKGNLNPDAGDPKCVPYGFGTDVQICENFGTPACWENHIAGVGYNTDGDSGATPAGCAGPLPNCDGFIGLEIPISLATEGVTEVSVVLTYGATVPGGGGEPCPADFDNSGAVDVKDLLFLLGAWGPCPPKGDCPADFDNSGAVDVKDLLFLLGAWGPCP